MISGPRRMELIRLADSLAKELRRYKAPENGAPVNRSQLEEVRRYLQAHPDGAGLQNFLNALPRSYLSRISQGAASQLGEVRRTVAGRLKQIQGMEELRYLLGWAARLLPGASHAARGTDRGDVR